MADKETVRSVKTVEDDYGFRKKLVVKDFRRTISSLTNLADAHDVPDDAWFLVREPVYYAPFRRTIVEFYWRKPYQPSIMDSIPDGTRF